MSINYYQILEILPNASESDIKTSFKKLAVKYHPDKHSGFEDKFKEINEAYSTLSDPIKRKEYDTKLSFSSQFKRWGAAFGKPNTATNFSHTAKKEAPKGTDIHIFVDITLDESIHGTKKIITVDYGSRCPLCDGTGAKTRKKCTVCKGIGMVKKIIGGEIKPAPCSSCNNSGLIIDDVCLHCKGTGLTKSSRDIEILINKGMKDGDEITVKGSGNAGFNGGAYGDVKIFINELPHKDYTRHGNDLNMKYEVSPIDLILGKEIIVNTPYGIVNTTIPMGTQVNSRIRIKGKGILDGDLYVGFNTIIPSNISDEEIELYKELRKMEFSNL